MCVCMYVRVCVCMCVSGMIPLWYLTTGVECVMASRHWCQYYILIHVNNQDNKQ